MRMTMTWMAAAVAATVMVGCGSAGDGVQTSRSPALVFPTSTSDVVDCSTLGLGNLEQVRIGYEKDGDLKAYELTYPKPIDDRGNTIDIEFDGPDMIKSWEVPDHVRVSAIIVRAPDTGTNAYLYDPAVSADEELRAPSGEGSDSIYRVKLCFEYVERDDGCTLTQGYWKTHSIHGPAPYDATWNGLEDAQFHASGKTYYQVMQTPTRGNAFYILAYQFIAARLNGMAGASMSAELQVAFDEAAALFAGATDDTLEESVRARAITLAGMLDAYNNGEVGPGHCE